MAKGPKPLPVKIRGKVYPSARAAAEALGVAQATVYSALHHGKPDHIGTGRARPTNGGNRSQTFTIGGVTYASKREASRALGRNDRYVSNITRRGTEQQKLSLVRQFMELHAKEELAIRKGGAYACKKQHPTKDTNT